MACVIITQLQYCMYSTTV